MQIPVDRLQNLNKILRTVAIQIFQFPDNIKAVTAVSVIAGVLHPVTAAATVKPDVARRLPVFIKRVQEVAPDAPAAWNVMFEHVQTVICPF
jgi:hypothetical protein